MEFKGKDVAFDWLSILVLIGLLCLPLHGYGQRLRFGAMVAGQVTNLFTQEIPPAMRSTSPTAFGPTVEVGLWRNLSIEVDALYRSKLNYHSGPYPGIFSNVGRHFFEHDAKAHSWEIPVLAEWHTSERFKMVFVGGGASFRKASGTYRFTETVTSFRTGQTSTFIDYHPSIGNLSHAWTYGGVVTAGIDIHKSIFHVRPQVRYTRWNASPRYLYMKADAVQVLMGISIGK
jgi:hypothetical protein